MRNEFSRFSHGLQKARETSRLEARRRMHPQSTGDMGARVALLQSPILPVARQHSPEGPKSQKRSESVTHVLGRKCYPCFGTFKFRDCSGYRPRTLPKSEGFRTSKLPRIQMRRPWRWLSVGLTEEGLFA